MFPFPTTSNKKVFDANFGSSLRYDSVSKDFQPAGIGSGPQCTYWSPDGTRLYAGYNNYIYQYSMSVAWDISTLAVVQGLSVSSSTWGIYFKPDGTAFFVVTSNKTFYKYSLSTAWDISTLTADGVLLYGNYNFSSAMYDKSVSGLFISSDGTKVFTTNSGGTTNYNKMYRVDLSTAWDITTGSYHSLGNTQQINNRGLFFSPDGRKVWISSTANGGNVEQRSLTTSWDLSTSSFDIQKPSISINLSNPETHFISSNPFFRPDGSKMYLLMAGTNAAPAPDDKIFQFSSDGAGS
tara:strand:- start:27 stop:908 length:882 start_codon:yes stop_codon:yes gene_type:complete